MLDIRAAGAKFYDLSPDPFDAADIAYYQSFLAAPDRSVLELGCGTGRVLSQLATRAIHPGRGQLPGHAGPLP